jgi:hypothetical protein
MNIQKFNYTMMKNLYLKCTLLLFSLLISSASAQIAEEIRIEEFKAVKGTNIDIDSKFGHVEILQWDKPSVMIEVRLKAESDDKQLANETLKKLSSEISSVGNDIFVKTIIEDRISSTPRKKITFSVDYTINAPEWINVKLLNKYGSVYAEELNGLVNMTVQYGSLTIRSLGRGNIKPYNEINLAYSKGTIEKSSWLKTDLAYSKLSIDEAQAVIAISKYSSLSADALSSLVVDSKYDTYSIEDLRNFAGEMRYANLKINELSKQMNITSFYTTVRVDKVFEGFESIIIDNSRGGYKLGIQSEASFNINGEASRGDIVTEGISQINKKSVNADKTIWGSFGNAKQKGEIKISTKEGSVRVAVL